MRSRTRSSTYSVGPAVLALVLGVLPGCGRGAAEGGGAPQPGRARAQKSYAPFPQPDAGYVTDIAGLLTPDEEERIERWLWQVESKTRVEIIVVLLQSIRDYPGTPNGSIEQFATALFNKYGIGNLPKNDGVLLLVARRDRKARIELGAHYGRDRDDDAKRIMDKVIAPCFKDDDYAQGITEGTRALCREFAGVRIGLPWMLIGILIAIPVVGLIAFSLFRNGKRGWGWVCVGLILVLVLAAIFILCQIVKHMPKSSSGSWSSGGLGGFGGGFSGGGGATGSW